MSAPPPTRLANNPTARRALQAAPRTHLRTTRANTPGALPSITRTNVAQPIPLVIIPRRSNRIALRNLRLISQEAINQLLLDNLTQDATPFIPTKLCAKPSAIVNYAHYAMPMIHHITGEHISSYKRLMNDPTTSEIWMTAFRKDFGAMNQGDDKTGQPGTNAMFVMNPANVPNIPKDRTCTYARVVVDHCPQQADPNRIRITAGGNLINYPGELTTRTADITTAKLLWNSVLSTPGAKYMCLDIKKFYLSAPLDRFEYMRIPFALFPPWIVEQYQLKDKVLNGHIYIEM